MQQRAEVFQGGKGWKSRRRSILIAQQNAGGEGVGNGFQFAELGMGEVSSGVGKSLALPGDLDDSDGARAQQNRGAHYFLDGRSALLLVNGDAFKDGSVRNHREMVDDFAAFFAEGSGGEGVVAGERNLADGSQSVRSQKAKRALVRSKSQDGDFMCLDVKILGD